MNYESQEHYEAAIGDAAAYEAEMYAAQAQAEAEAEQQERHYRMQEVEVLRGQVLDYEDRIADLWCRINDLERGI